MTDSPSRAAVVRRGGTPEWLVNLSALGWRVLVLAVLVGVVVVIAGRLITVTASILLALLIAASFEPWMVSLRARGWSQAKAAAAVTAAVVAVVTLAVIILFLALVPYIADVVRQVNAGLDVVRSDATSGTGLPADAAGTVSNAIGSVQGSVSETASGVVASIATMVTIAILGGILTFFFLRDGLKALVTVVPRGTPHRRTVISLIGRRAIPSAGRYLRVAGTYGAIDAVIAFLVLRLLDVPLAAPLAVAVFLAAFVPYLGVPVAISALGLVALGTHGTATAVVLVALLGGIYWLTRRQLRPIIPPEPTGLNPATILITVLVASALGGYAAMVAVVPGVIIGRAIADALVLVLEPGARSSGTFLVPGWLDRLADIAWRLLVTLALLAFGVGLLGAFPIVMLPLLIAAVLAATFAPVMTWLVRRGWSPLRAAAGITAGSISVVVGVVVLCVVSLVSQSERIASTATQGADKADSTGVLGDTVAAFGSGIDGVMSSVGVAVASGFVVIALSALLCFYLLRDGARQWGAIVMHLPAPARPRLTSIAEDAADILGRYMLGTGAISAFGAASQYLTMFVLGLPMALPLAVLSFFGGFVPYIGSWITTGLAFLVTIATGSPFDILVMAIFTIVFNVVTGNVVAPIVYSRAVNLHPAVVLLAIPAGNAIAGVLGMFLAVPVIGIAVTTWRPILQLAGTMPSALSTPEPIRVVPVPAAAPTPPLAATSSAADAGLEGVRNGHRFSFGEGARRFLRRTAFRGRPPAPKA